MSATKFHTHTGQRAHVTKNTKKKKEWRYDIDPAEFLGVYQGGSKSFRPDIQKPRQKENAARDI